jgi:predicted nuclease of predicted toxin-antitoxin system
MKFLVDAQLPRQLCVWLSQQGEDVLHTLDLPNGNRTSDREITAIAKAQDRIVVS